MKFITWLNNNQPIAAILKLAGFLSIVWSVLSYFNLMPYYQVKLYKVNTITPIINLFPGQKIRLDLEFHKTITRQDIDSADWQLLKNNTVLFDEKGLEPTIALPLTEGGIYQLKINATLQNEKMTGETNLYVVQDTPKQITLPPHTEVSLTTANNSLSFLKRIQSQGAEIYMGNSQWEKAEAISESANKVTIKLEPNRTIPLFNNEILVRAQGLVKDLSNYSTAQIHSEPRN